MAEYMNPAPCTFLLLGVFFSVIVQHPHIPAISLYFHEGANAQDYTEARCLYRLGRSGCQRTSGTIIPLRKASISEADTPHTLTR